LEATVADAFYDQYRNSISGLQVHTFADLDTDDIRIVMYDEGADALNLADQDLADIASAARISVSSAITSVTIGTIAVGTFDHADVTFTSVTGASVESLTYYKHTGTDSTSPLIANIDSATGLPFTPSGGNVIWVPNASGVWRHN
jgi:hypothetical protein